ncbi:MAG TPA: prepilin-type N-terminal cleavage/methylation domain-containing protein [Sedimentisphaerales bacterium]|nr:prepilin-type N-terminal cleavage/methylation domain-containing protein [Sedimentisphaerales bacterium]
MKSNRAFTMVELMVVVLIVGILAAVAVPLMSGRVDGSKWSEGKAAMGTIASAVRAYAAEKGKSGVKAEPTWGDLGIAASELDGTYFLTACYKVSGVSVSDAGVLNFTITCDPALGRNTAPKKPAKMTLTGNGSGQVFEEG